MMLTFIAFLSMTQANEVLNQFEKYYKNARSLSVKLKMHIAGRKEEGTGTYRYQKPARQAFRMQIGNTNYQWQQSEKASLEIEHSVKLYHEYEPAGEFVSPSGDLSDIPTYSFPAAMASGSLRSLVPGNVSFSIVSPPEGAESGSTNLFATYSNGRFMVELTALVAKDGRLLRLFSSPKDAAATMGVEMLYSEYAANVAPPKDAFSTKLPLGYMPQVLKAWPDPVNVGMTAPLTGIVPLSGPKTDLLSATHHKPTLVVVLAPEGEPAKNLFKFLPQMATKLKAKGAGVAIIWTEKRRLTGSPKVFTEFFDSKGSVLDRFFAAGTPFMMMLDGKGKIAQIWVGFDPQIAGRYLREAVETAGYLTSPSD